MRNYFLSISDKSYHFKYNSNVNIYQNKNKYFKKNQFKIKLYIN